MSDTSDSGDVDSILGESRMARFLGESGTLLSGGNELEEGLQTVALLHSWRGLRRITAAYLRLSWDHQMPRSNIRSTRNIMVPSNGTVIRGERMYSLMLPALSLGLELNWDPTPY